MAGFFLLTAAFLVPSVAWGYDWSQHAAGSTVTLAAGDVTVTDADYPAVSALKQIDLSAPESRLIFDLSGDLTASPLGCSVIGFGQIVKRGTGTLHFGTPHNTVSLSNQGWADYFTTNGIAVEAGVLKLPQDTTSGVRLGPVELSEGAVLYSQNKGEVVVEALNGYGLVTNTASSGSSVRFRIGNSPETTAKSVFRGVLAGPTMQVRTDGYTELVNSNNTYGADLQIVLNADSYTKTNRGITAVAFLGLTGGASSMGTSSQVQLRYGGTLRYLGTGETCDKRLYLFATAKTPNALDAGETGGINWTGEIYARATADGLFTFKGDGAKENVYSGAADMAYLGWTWYFAKEGAGTWHLADNDKRCNDGAWAVREGTLKFDSLANKGQVCALGVATQLFSAAYVTDVAKRTPVDYAVLLGSAGQNPVLEFSGSGQGLSFDRPLRLTGTGGVLRNSTETGEFCLYGIAAEDAGAKTLTLDGTNTVLNIAGTVSDGAGTLNILKTGTGTWRLEGDQTFSGTLTVSAGTLVVAATPTQFAYSYYKLTDRQNYKKDQYFWLRRIGLYDKDGHLLARDLVEDAPVVDTQDGNWIVAWHFEDALKPGHARWDMPSKFIYYSASPAAAVFAESTTAARSAMSGGVKLASPSYWPSIVWRMPEGSAPVATFDLEEHVDHTTDGHPAYLTLYGSADGLNWTELYTLDATSNTTAPGYWLSDGSKVTNNAARPGAGYTLPPRQSLSASASYSQLAAVAAVTVAPGATLKAEGAVTLAKLTVDCLAGNGTVDGFDFAAKGTVDLLGYTAGEGPARAAFTLENLPEGALSRLNAREGWSVTIGGEAAPRYRVRFNGTTAEVMPPGTLLIVR